MAGLGGLLARAPQVALGCAVLVSAPDPVVLTNTAFMSSTRSRLLDVLNAHVKALLQDPAANLLVDLYAHGTLGHVPNTTSLALVEPVGHTLVNGTIDSNVDDVTQAV